MSNPNQVNETFRFYVNQGILALNYFDYILCVKVMKSLILISMTFMQSIHGLEERVEINIFLAMNILFLLIIGVEIDVNGKNNNFLRFNSNYTILIEGAAKSKIDLTTKF